MDFDAFGGTSPTLTSLLVHSLTTLSKRTNGRARKNTPGRGPGRTNRPDSSNRRLGSLGDRSPIRSWTKPITVASLEVYEGRGHTIARHVNHAPNADVERLRREPDIPASGSFTDVATAQRALDAAVAANVSGIGNWLSQGKAKGPFVRDYDMGEPIGSVLTRSAFNAATARGETPQLLPATAIRIVLRKSSDFEGGFFVLTAYPLPRTDPAAAPHFAVEPLRSYEGLGHTVSRHVDLERGELVSRLENEADISASSRFTDLETAQRVVEQGIREKAAEINDWLETGGRGPFNGDVTLKEVIGVVLTRAAYERGRRQPQAATRIHFVLIKSADHPSGFYVKTAYPVVPW